MNVFSIHKKNKTWLLLRNFLTGNRPSHNYIIEAHFFATWSIFGMRTLAIQVFFPSQFESIKNHVSFAKLIVCGAGVFATCLKLFDRCIIWDFNVIFADKIQLGKPTFPLVEEKITTSESDPGDSNTNANRGSLLNYWMSLSSSHPNHSKLHTGHHYLENSLPDCYAGDMETGWE